MDPSQESIELRLQLYLAQMPEASQRELVEVVARIVREHAQREREQAIAFCMHRAELWRHTRPNSPLEHEARARANEALYIADYFATSQTDGAEDDSGEPDCGMQAKTVSS